MDIPTPADLQQQFNQLTRGLIDQACRAILTELRCKQKTTHEMSMDKTMFPNEFVIESVIQAFLAKGWTVSIDNSASSNLRYIVKISPTKMISPFDH